MLYRILHRKQDILRIKNAATQKAYAQILQKKQNERKTILLFFVGLLLVVPLLYHFSFLNFSVFLFLLVFIVSFGIGFLIFTVLLSQKEYESIPGSFDANGNARCIFCQGKATIREGVQDAQNRNTFFLLDCTECKKNLWAEPMHLTKK